MQWKHSFGLCHGGSPDIPDRTLPLVLPLNCPTQTYARFDGLVAGSSRVRVCSQTKASIMMAPLLVVLLVAALAESQVHTLAQETSKPSHEATSEDNNDSAKVAAAVLQIRELAKSSPVPFKEIEALALQAEETGNPGRICAVVAAICREHGSPAQTVHWAKTALQHPLAGGTADLAR